MAKRRLSRRQLARVKQQQERRRQRLSVKSTTSVAHDETTALGPEQTGLVIANYGANLIVEDANGRLYRCTLRQHLSTLVCGDRLIWQASSDDEGVVVALEQRRSLLARPDYSGQPKPMAANLDQVAVVFAPRPEPNEFLIDRYLVAIESIGVAALLVLNKIDLLDAESAATLEARLATYRRIGYPLLSASTRSARGLDALRRHLHGHTSIMVGQSGVGKSSLIKALLPERAIRIQALSEATGLGTHTTTTSMLYHLPLGGDLIDSPGVRGFEPNIASAEALQHGFVEFRPLLGQCRFADCSHGVEPDCALRAAAACGAIDPRRLASYQQLRATLPEQAR